MGIEIERKFLVDRDEWKRAQKGERTLYQQGYLSNEPAKTVRIRVSDDAAFLTIKGEGSGMTRPEFEYGIPKEDAEQMLRLFCSAVISKYRYRVVVDGKLWEVDEFLEENEGLLLAEIELSREDETFSLPSWVAEEVTKDERYFNAYLSLHPYKTWK